MRFVLFIAICVFVGVDILLAQEIWGGHEKQGDDSRRIFVDTFGIKNIESVT